MKYVIAAVLVAGLSAPASADKKVMIAPLDGAVSSYPSLPDRLGETLARAAQQAGVEHSKGAVGLVELGLMSNCSIDKEPCRKQLLATLGARALVAGSISDETGQVEVNLVYIKPGGEVSGDSHTLSGGSEEELVASFEPIAAALFSNSATDPTATDPVGPSDADPVDPDVGVDPENPIADPITTPPAAGGDPRRDTNLLTDIEPWTLGLIGGGAALTAGGFITLALAGDIQNDIDEAPTATPADLDALEELESRGRLRYRLSYVLLGVGAVSLAAGITFAILQRREAKRSVAVVPTGDGGVAAVIGGSF
jgi:hypothetical protein